MKNLLITFLLASLFTPLFAQGYVQPTDNFHDYQVTHQRTTLPEKYDSRNYGWVLAPRDQVIGGTCWAFSCATAWQIWLHKNGLETGYLSPQTLTTCFKGFNVKPITGGGNTRMANSMLARLEGLILEEAVPYNYENTACQSYSQNDVPAYILGWNYLPSGDDIAIKEHIMKYGSVCASLYYTSTAYNNTTQIYQYQGNASPNHAITIIGWDDSKQAWITQSSWGTTAFNGGYVMVSYKDSKINKECTAYTNYTDVNSINHVHHYTSVGSVAAYGLEVKTVSDGIVQYHFEDGEQLAAIGTAIAVPNLRVSFSVIDLNAMAFLYASEAVTIPYAGFYKHELPQPVNVKGDICIAVTYYSDSEKHIIPIEANVENHYNITLHPNNQWIDFNESGNWIPFGSKDYPYNLCIYAYTQKTTTAIEQPATHPTTVFTGSGIDQTAWDVVKNIRVCGMDGKLYKTLSSTNSAMPNLVTGVYLLIIEKQDGTVYTEKIWIQ